MAIPKSVCDDCINTECLWRTPTGGHDPPMMACSQKTEKPKTNADRIRAMTDEELVEWLHVIMDCEFCPAIEKATCWHGKYCRERLHDWLQQEVENGDTA